MQHTREAPGPGTGARWEAGVLLEASSSTSFKLDLSFAQEHTLFSNSRRHAILEHITVEAERDRVVRLFAHFAGLLSDQAQPVRPSDELSRPFFSLLSIAHHLERVVAKNGAQFRRMMDDEWDAQTSKHACHPGEIFHFTADEYSIVLLFKMPL